MDDELFLETYCTLTVCMKRCVNKKDFLCVRWPAAITAANLFRGE